jgi:cytochrome d ubiquinol oxidase subunit I
MIRRVDGPATALVLKTGVYLAAVLAPLQVLIGDQHGLNTLEHQPGKIAAIEAIWETDRGVPFTVLGWPDEERRETHFALEIPRGSSLILTHDPNGEVRGLDQFAGKHPPVAVVFFSFRIMVGIGLLMIAVSWSAAWALRRGGVPGPLVMRALSLMTFAGWVATLAGWITTEVGRQPWIIYDALTVAEVVAPHPAGKVAGTLIAYIALYAFLLVSYILTLRYMSTKPAKSLRMLGPVREPVAAER